MMQSKQILFCLASYTVIKVICTIIKPWHNALQGITEILISTLSGLKSTYNKIWKATQCFEKLYHMIMVTLSMCLGTSPAGYDFKWTLIPHRHSFPWGHIKPGGKLSQSLSASTSRGADWNRVRYVGTAPAGTVNIGFRQRWWAPCPEAFSKTCWKTSKQRSRLKTQITDHPPLIRQVKLGEIAQM